MHSIRFQSDHVTALVKSKSLKIIRYPAQLKLTFQCSLANHEMRAILASLMWHFDFELCRESDDWLNQEVHLLWVKSPLMVKAKYVR